MQVTNAQEHVTHAVMGKNQAIEFGITNDASFFQVLSDSLYSDKPLAVVREVMCNAWDAHIESGRTDVPFKVNIIDDHFIVEDFGPGIAPDMMGPLYGTYGGTNKKTNLMVTGGFGLGCKSPFAVCDHFEVQSSFDGTATIYTISKSSAMIDGKPGITPIVQFPSTQTGVRVKVPLRPGEEHKFLMLAYRIAAAGEMNCIINDAQAKIIKFSEAKQGFMLVRKEVLGDSNSTINIRYGNVIYPLSNHDNFRSLYNNISEWVKKLPTNFISSISGWSLVLQAEPNTIAITPSRESISMTDSTIKSINALLMNFWQIHNKEFAPKLNKALKESTKNPITPVELINKLERIPRTAATKVELPYLNNFDDAARYSAAHTYLGRRNNQNVHYIDRLKVLSKSGFFNRGRINSLIRTSRKKQYESNWLLKSVLYPIQKHLNKDDLTKLSKLYIYQVNEYSYRPPKFIPIEQIGDQSLIKNIPYLRNYVILTHNRLDVSNRAAYFPAFKNWFGEIKSSIVVMVPRRKDRVQATRDVLTKLGYYIIDATERQSWEPEDVAVTLATPEPRAKPKKGLVALKEIVNTDIKIDTSLIWATDVDRIMKPSFVVKITDRNVKRSFHIFDQPTSYDVIDLFGSIGGIAVTDTQMKKYLLNGSQHIDTFLLKEIENEFKNNTRIQSKFSIDPNKNEIVSKWNEYPYSNQHKIEMIQLILRTDILAKEFKVENQLTLRDIQILSIWDRMKRYRHAISADDKTKMDEISTYVDSFSESPDLQKLVDLVDKSTITSIISCENIQTKLNSSATTPAEQTRIRDIVLKIVKE